MGETYAASGVDIAAGDAAVQRIRDKVRSTHGPEVLGNIGSFGGLYDFPSKRYDRPVLVSTTDGVGTKVLIAERVDRYDTIGIDLVAMCVDDLVCQGAEPLFLLDYIATGRLDPDQVDQVISGIVDGCRMAGCALIGGEMAEHPGAMEEGHLDLAGFAVGAVERDRIIDGSAARAGDVLLGLPSPGLRSNGYSLARRVLFDMAGLDVDDELYDGHSVGDELLRPSVIYTPAVVQLVAEVEVRAIAHITGGGLRGNLPRVLPEGLTAVVDRSTWQVPPVFTEIQRRGDIHADEMARVFNLGIGMVLVVAPADARRARESLRAEGHQAIEMGELVPATDADAPRVRFV